MRDRKAALGKRVEFILSKEAHDYIAKELHLPETHKITTANISRMVQINQDRELNDQLIMSAFGKIKEVMHQHLNSLQLNPKVPPRVIRQKAAKINQLIGEAVKDAPYENLGKWEENIATG